MKQTFEQFLQEKHFTTHPQLLDDDITDSYDTWVSQLDTQEVIDFAELYGKQCFIDGKEKVQSDIVRDNKNNI